VPLFGPKDEAGAEGPSLTATQGIFGGTVEPAEGTPGTIQRRYRLYLEATRLVRSGDDVRGKMAAALEAEVSLIKWVSLRGALTDLVIATEGGTPSIEGLLTTAPRPAPPDLIDTLRRYDSISKMSFGDVLGDPTLVRVPSWHLDVIAWAAEASVAADANVQIGPAPRAGRLTAPGWYVEPVFAKSERFWDGQDWTARCRVLDGRTYRAISAPF